MKKLPTKHSSLLQTILLLIALLISIEPITSNVLTKNKTNNNYLILFKHVHYTNHHATSYSCCNDKLKESSQQVILVVTNNLKMNSKKKPKKVANDNNNARDRIHSLAKTETAIDSLLRSNGVPAALKMHKIGMRVPLLSGNLDLSTMRKISKLVRSLSSSPSNTVTAVKELKQPVIDIIKFIAKEIANRWNSLNQIEGDFKLFKKVVKITLKVTKLFTKKGLPFFGDESSFAIRNFFKGWKNTKYYDDDEDSVK